MQLALAATHVHAGQRLCLQSTSRQYSTQNEKLTTNKPRVDMIDASVSREPAGMAGHFPAEKAKINYHTDQ